MAKSKKSPARPALPAEIAEKILDADFQNVVKKVASGKPLSQTERARIEARAAGCTDSSAYAKDKVELAGLLGIDRRTLTRWQKIDGAPKPLSNGLWPVADWREFVRSKNLKGCSTPAIDDGALKSRKLLAEVEEREFRLGVRRGEYIAVCRIKETWTGKVAHATAVLRAKFENELPPVLSGLDATGIQTECRHAIDEVLRCLHES